MIRALIIVATAAAFIGLQGCAWFKKKPDGAVIQTVVERQFPPQVLMQDCPPPPFPDQLPTGTITNNDLVSYILEQRAVISACNIDKLNLREWVMPSIEPGSPDLIDLNGEPHPSDFED